MPPELRAKLIALETIQNDPDPIAWVKIVLPNTRFTWYVCAFDGHDTYFGLEAGYELKTGEFSLNEVQSLCNPHDGKPIARDDRFTPTRLSALRPKHEPGIVWSPLP